MLRKNEILGGCHESRRGFLYVCTEATFRRNAALPRHFKAHGTRVRVSDQLSHATKVTHDFRFERLES